MSGVWVRVGLRMDTKKASCSKEIGLCAQNMLTFLGSIVNMVGSGWGELYDYLMSTKIFSLIMNKIV